jgi:hypothetical protein
MIFPGLFAILTLLAATPAALQSGSGVIEGVVIEAGTGQPIPGTRITLYRGGPARETTTDERGRFAFAGLSQGGYSVSAQRDGYLGTGAGGTFQRSVSTPVNVDGREPIKPVTLSLALGGVISGRLLDPVGRPLPNMMMEVLTENSRDRSRAYTNDRGEFRFTGLAPARYVVAASPLIRPNAGVRDTYVRTYYPGTSESNRAVPVIIALGSEVPGVDFTIQTSIVVSVSGRVILDVPDVQFPYTASLQPTLLLHSFDPDPLNTQATRYPPQAVDRSNGQFEIRGVQPGRYELVVSIPGGGSAYTGRTRIDAGYQNLKDVTIVVRPGVDVPVQVIVKPGLNVAAVQNVELRIKDSPRPIVISSGRGGSESFLIQHVPAGEYEVFVTTLPTTRVADIQHAGRSVLKEGIVVGDQPLEPLYLIVERALPSSAP